MPFSNVLEVFRIIKTEAWADCMTLFGHCVMCHVMSWHCHRYHVRHHQSVPSQAALLIQEGTQFTQMGAARYLDKLGLDMIRLVEGGHMASLTLGTSWWNTVRDGGSHLLLSISLGTLILWFWFDTSLSLIQWTRVEPLGSQDGGSQLLLASLHFSEGF